MAVRLGRRKLIAVGTAAVVLVFGMTASLGPAVRARVSADASRRGLDVSVGSVRAGWFAVRLLDVSTHPRGVESVRAHADDARIGLSIGLHVDRIEIRGLSVTLKGPLESIRDELRRWREGRPQSERGQPSTTAAVEVVNGSLQWTDESGPNRTAALHGMSISRDGRGTRLAVTEGHVRYGKAAVDLSDGALEADAKGMLVRARARRVTLGWAPGPLADSVSSSSSSAASLASLPMPAPPAPVIARANRGGAKRPHLSPPPQPPPADPGAPLLAIPDLHIARATVAAAVSLLIERVEQRADVGVDSLTWRVVQDSGQDPERVALTFGPGPLAFTRSDSQLELHYSTEAHAAGTPLAVRVTVSSEARGGHGDGGDVVMTVEGGPVSLSLLGVREGAAGLVDVDHATVSGRARVVLAGDGGSLTFDADGAAHGLSLSHPRLALDTVRGLDLALRARGNLASTGEVRLDELVAALGALRLSASGVLDQQPDHVSGAARFEIPPTSCQSLLDSIPGELLPTLRGARIAGTFGAHGRFGFDTRAVDDLELKYDIADRCRLVHVPPDLDHDRFAKPFSHRIYQPDGSTIDETTGPGTPDWAPLDEISPYMQTAVLTTEDGAFPKHHGFNHAAIRASVIANLKARRFVRGASTITMQLAKNLFLSRDKTVSRKLEEVVLTDYLEQTFTKDELLELYFNVVEFGPSVYGITSAAEYYFGRGPAELNLAECLFLSSILPAPLRYATMRAGDQPPDGWMRILHTLMEVAHKRGLITDEELAEGEGETVAFWHGGPHPSPRQPARAHSPSGDQGEDVPDPFATMPDVR